MRPAVLCLFPALALACASARAGDAGGSSPPTLEEHRDCLLRYGVPPRLVRIEEAAVSPAEPVAREASDQGTPRPSDLPRRLVFWTKTGEITQTVIVAVIEGPPGREEERYVRIQSAGLASAPDGHARLAELMAYMLDRNFAMTGAQFARDAADGEVVLRADVPCSKGIADADFTQAVESVVRAAEHEGLSLAAVLSR